MSNIKPFRSRKFNLLLYEEHQDIINLLLTSYDVALIKHDKDIDDLSNKKATHYHCVLSFKNAKWNTSLSNELSLDLRFITKTNDYYKSLLYLIHYNNPEKYQYDIEDVKGTLKKDLYNNINSIDLEEHEKISQIIDFIIDNSSCLTISQLTKFCATHSLWSTFRRSSYLFIRMLEEERKLKR